MFGDYYTNTSSRARRSTNMLGNNRNLFVRGGPEKEPRRGPDDAARGRDASITSGRPLRLGEGTRLT